MFGRGERYVGPGRRGPIKPVPPSPYRFGTLREPFAHAVTVAF